MRLKHYKTPLTIDGHPLDFERETIVMGILNVTPDSFSDGGQFNTVEAAVNHAKQMVKDGAKIIDIGGESTRPGHTPITADEELKRVLPVIEAIRKEVDVLLSIDTFKAEVAERAVKAGVHIINDIWGGKKDPQILRVAARHHVPIILMHNRTDENYGDDFLKAVTQDLEESIALAKEAGVEESHIWLDPGVGFAKTRAQDLEIIKELHVLTDIGYPVLLATSRKRVIGEVLDLPKEQRVEGTAATCCYGVTQGCHLVRVHDVKPVARMMKMMDALK